MEDECKQLEQLKKIV